jgi:hypothetical protein
MEILGLSCVFLTKKKTREIVAKFDWARAMNGRAKWLLMGAAYKALMA